MLANFPAAVSLFYFLQGYKNADTLSVGDGYWVNMPSAQTDTIQVVPALACTLDAPVGWSMIGTIYGGVAVADIQQTPDKNVISIFGFDSSGYKGVSLDAGILAQGAGYWVNLRQVGQLLMQSHQDGAGRGIAVEETEFKGPILWAESGAHRQVLHLGVPANRVVELPPLPPAGALDARVRVGEVDTWQIPETMGSDEYELRVQGEAVTLGWNVPAEAEGWWELVIDGHVVPLSGTGTVELGDTGAPAHLQLRYLGVMSPAYRLAPNYPNPFNTATTIRYEVGGRARVSLRVYEITGQLVRQLVSETQGAGLHQVVWDGRNAGGVAVSSGVYFYELRAGTFRAVRKMVLMK